MTVSNPEAEAALIYSLVLDPTQIMDVDLTDEDFTVGMWSSAYSKIKALVEQDQPVDVLILRNDGIEISAMELAGFHAPATSYAKIIKDASYRRSIMEAAEKIALVAETADESSIIGAMEDALAVVSQRKQEGSDVGLQDLADFREVPPQPHLGILAPEGTTVIYGEGGDGKGWIAAAMIKGLLDHGIKTAILDFENHPGEWAYRLDKLGVSLSDVSYFQPGMNMGKWASPKVAQVLKDKAVKFLVIDSAMYASASDDPYSPQGVMQYKQARLRLGNMPALLLAHTAKGQTSIYGSAFWRNEARITWYLSRDNTNKRSMLCKKTNAYPHLEGKKLMVDFNESTGMLNFHEVGQPFTSYIKSPVQSPALVEEPEREVEFSW